MNEERTVTLEEKILHLISLQQEGGYWDFKKQWYEKKNDMLHDIICMANNLHNCTAYIIIGVDEKQGYAVVDVKNDPNRRNTQNMVDFLKDKKFAGGVRPLVHVEQLSLYHGDIDVIVVENSRNTPFYLTERFEGICANHIYTRVMDTNTPIDRSADINNVEYLWRKRFHLDDTPIGKFHHYLKNPDDWYSMQDQNRGYFYKYSPEYTITCEKDICTDGYEYYLFGQVDTRPSWYLITLKYHQTSIELFQGLSLDGGRSFVIAPQRAYDLMDADISSIGFYICDDLRARLLEFYHCKDTSDEYAYRAYMRSMIVFRSEREHKQFIRYVKENKERYNVLYAQQGDKGLPHFPEIEGYIMDAFKNEYRDALIMQKMLTEFRNGTPSEITEDKVYADAGWIGKDKVVNHHLDVPYRVLERQYSFDENGQHIEDNGSDNMIIHGDNLEALKSLLPQYEGRVKCIYIDPPYNTGNEGWVYNDNVNDPRIRKWLGDVVGKEGEDLTRHDKWLCMMYPRLKLLQKLLADDGAIFISIDDNEQANLKMLCDEIFGSTNFAAQIIWEKVYSPRMDEIGFSTSHDYILSYVKGQLDIIQKECFEQKKGQFNFVEAETGRNYRRRSVRKEGSQSLRSDRPNLFYPLIAPDGSELFPIKPDGTEGRWRWAPETYEENMRAGSVEWVKNANGWQVYAKQYIETEAFRPPVTLWKCDEVGHNHSAAEELKAIFQRKVFDTPKPKELVQKIISLICDKESIILDSFAGSGTTAHAVLNMNKADGGNRKFILIEMMDYADGITAERVKRVIHGYGSGKNAVAGTGGSFSYYELGEPLMVGDILNENVGVDKIREYVYFTDTKSRLPEAHPDEPYYMGVHINSAYYFYYEKQAVTTLNREFLHTVKTKADAYVIYADLCTLSDAELEKYHITFKKIPRDITKL